MSNSRSASRRIRLKHNVLFAAAAFFLSIVSVLAAVEIVVRLAWKNPPDCLRPVEDAMYQKEVIGDRKIVSLAPGAQGCAIFSEFRINSKGFRGPDYGEKKAGRPRIVIVGDSFVYGVGLPENRTLSAALEREFAGKGVKADVINGGMPSYNLDQNVMRAGKAVADYHPDVVVMSLIYNDIENNPSSMEYGIAPLLSAGGKDSLSGRTLLWKVSHLMLPLGVRKGVPPAEFRFALARKWRTYQYLALFLRFRGEKPISLGRNLPFARTQSRQMERLIWNRVNDSLEKFRELSEIYRFKPLLMIYMDFEIQGYPVQRVKELARKNGIAVLDLSPLWGGYRHYLNKYSMGWDAHPNGEANSKAAGILANYMAVKEWIPGKPGERDTETFENHERLTRLHDEKARELLREQLEVDRKLKDNFVSELVPAAKGGNEDQWLFGWWPAGRFKWNSGGGRIMSGQGGFFLKVPAEGGTGLVLQGYRIEKTEPFPKLGVSVWCDGRPITEIDNISNRKFDLKVKSNSALRPSSVIECELFSSRVATPDSLGYEGARDGRLVSLAFTRIAIFQDVR